MPDVELLAWSGCPSHEQARRRLRSALDDLGLVDEPIVVRWVETDEDAAELSFVGSPTVRVGGREVIPPASVDNPALTCRVYRLPDGRFSPLPDQEELRTNLAALLNVAKA
jgi:hypothetical protein